MRVLLVEDNKSLANWTAKALRHSGMVVDCMGDGMDADHVLATQSYDTRCRAWMGSRCCAT